MEALTARRVFATRALAAGWVPATRALAAGGWRCFEPIDPSSTCYTLSYTGGRGLG